MKRLLVAAIALLPLLPGCFGPTSEDFIRGELEKYHVVLHPLLFTWDAETKTLSGNVTISNLEPSRYTRLNDETGIAPALQIRYFDDRPFADGDPPPLASWTLRIGEKIQNDKALVWNFSVTPDASIASVEIIDIDLWYEFRVRLSDGSQEFSDKVLVSYSNPCLEVNGDRVQQRVGIAECDPYRWRETHDSLYRMTINGDHLAPVEDWNNWGKIWEPLVPVRDYLNDFSYGDVTYYDGDVSCNPCNSGG